MKMSLIAETQDSCEPKWSRKSRPRSKLKKSFELVGEIEVQVKVLERFSHETLSFILIDPAPESKEREH